MKPFFVGMLKGVQQEGEMGWLQGAELLDRGGKSKFYGSTDYGESARRADGSLFLSCIDQPDGRRWVAYRTKLLADRNLRDEHSRPIYYTYGVVSRTAIDSHQAASWLDQNDDEFAEIRTRILRSWQSDGPSPPPPRREPKDADWKVNQPTEPVKPRIKIGDAKVLWMLASAATLISVFAICLSIYAIILSARTERHLARLKIAPASKGMAVPAAAGAPTTSDTNSTGGTQP